MSSVALELTRDDVSPALALLAGAGLQRRVLMAAGTVLASLGQRAVDEPGLRPAAWPARKSGGANPLLVKSGTLRHSIHAQLAGADAVKVGTPVIYGAVHQLGSAKSSGRGSGIPARPFFPVTAGGQLTDIAVVRMHQAVARVIAGA